MKVAQAVAEILKRENVEVFVTFPTNYLIEALSGAGIKPIVCRQERVGVGIADGFARVSDGKRISVFTMQFGPGAENSYAGIATAYSDSVPILLLPAGHRRDRSRVSPFFSSYRAYQSETKYVEEMLLAQQIADCMRRSISNLKTGRPGPIMLEIPRDVLTEEVNDAVVKSYRPVTTCRSQGDPDQVAKAGNALLDAQNPVILAGQGLLYSGGCQELFELAELLDIPVMTTLEGKSAFPENHPLSLGTAALTNPRPVVHFLQKSDVVLAIGCSLTKHAMAITIPEGKTIIHVTNDWKDVNKDYSEDFPILGDAKLVLLQFIEIARERKENRKVEDSRVRREIASVKQEWLKEWMPTLTSGVTPINPYRIIWDFITSINPSDAIVTHDSGSARDMMIPFYVATVPHSYIGWGKSHGLGTGLGLVIGAKLASPEKFCVNFMGDGAFGMTGLDFETSVRSKLPITTIVWNNSTMGSEKEDLMVSHERYRLRDLSGNYSEMGKAMGGYSERIENPHEIISAIKRAKQQNENGKSVLLEFMTGEYGQTNYSHMKPF